MLKEFKIVKVISHSLNAVDPSMLTKRSVIQIMTNLQIYFICVMYLKNE